MANKILACKCGDCAHWLIGAPASGWGGFLGTSWSHPNSFIRCKTCGVELKVTITVDPHTHLIEVDDAPDTPKIVRESAQPCGCDPGANWVCQQHQTPQAVAPVYVPIQDDPIGDLVMGGIVGAAIADAFEEPAVLGAGIADTSTISDAPMPDTSFDATGFSDGESGGGGGGSDY